MERAKIPPVRSQNTSTKRSTRAVLKSVKRKEEFIILNLFIKMALFRKKGLFKKKSTKIHKEAFQKRPPFGQGRPSQRGFSETASLRAGLTK